MGKRTRIVLHTNAEMELQKYEEILSKLEGFEITKRSENINTKTGLGNFTIEFKKNYFKIKEI